MFLKEVSYALHLFDQKYSKLSTFITILNKRFHFQEMLLNIFEEDSLMS